MDLIKKTDHFDSSNGTDSIAYYVYTPTCGTRAIVQIVHGMCEYCERYEDFIGFLCKNGIAVCCHDHLGHGNSCPDPERLGYFAPKRGWHFLARDTARLTRLMKTSGENYNLPYYILGHSMGSLITRTVLAKYGYMYDGAVIMGTVNTKIGSDAGIALTKAISRIMGGTYRSGLIDRIVFGFSNSRIEDPISEYSWLSRDDDAVLKYEKDPYCNFHFTASGYSDLMFLLNYVSRGDWAKKIDKDLPIFVCSGGEDPVGLYGHAPQKVFDVLNDAGLTDLELKIYGGARHEILNETCRDEVYSDILEWLNDRIGIQIPN